jgi:hypothetical protein
MLLPACSCDGGAAEEDAAAGLDALVEVSSDSGAIETGGGGHDAEGLDAPGLDAVSQEDAPGAGDAPGGEDAARREDAAIATDVGRIDAGCPRSEPTRMAGICDGRGRAICQMWSDGLAGGRMTIASCVAGGFCARASSCTASDPDTCTCGASPRCPDDRVCVFSEGMSPRCECISP